MKQQTARDFHIDNIKGVLIFLVVLGHMLGYLQEMCIRDRVYRDTAPHPIFSDSKFIQWADGKLTISFK